MCADIFIWMHDCLHIFTCSIIIIVRVSICACPPCILYARARFYCFFVFPEKLILLLQRGPRKTHTHDWPSVAASCVVFSLRRKIISFAHFFIIFFSLHSSHHHYNDVGSLSVSPPCTIFILFLSNKLLMCHCTHKKKKLFLHVHKCKYCCTVHQPYYRAKLLQ